MEPPPLTVQILGLTPYSVVPGLSPGSAPPTPNPASPSPSASPSHGARAPAAAVPATPAPPPTLPRVLLSPTSNYPPPFGIASLGETLAVRVALTNTSSTPVRGAKMMLEVQSPVGRFRLGEAIHGETHRPPGTDPSHADERKWEDLPALAPGEGLELAGSHDIAELKTHILICSVAWETQEGRRTFQRFFKFNVNAPIDIKTRVYTPSAPNAVLSPQRSDIYLEVLMYNISPSAMLFHRIVLDPVPGLQARIITKGEAAAAGVVPEGEYGAAGATGEAASLLPGDTMQRLFVLSPTDENTSVPALEGPTGALLANLPVSSFPPTYATATILPLGRLDIGWVSGMYRERGRFQTSTLNRRTPVVPLLNAQGSGPGSRPGTPTRLSMAMSQVASARNSLVAPKWEFDLLLEAPRSVPIEDVFDVELKVAVRTAPVLGDSADPPAPPPLKLGVQLLHRPTLPPPNQAPPPVLSIRPPSRINTPSALPGRPASPTVNLSRSSSLSRPMTPVSQQLRHAAVSNLASPASTPPSVVTPPPIVPAVPPAAAFPPPPLGTPVMQRGVAPPPPGRAVPLGASLVLPTPVPWRLVRERVGTTYAAEVPGTTMHRRWEAAYSVPVRFLALAGGLAELGGARVLLMDETVVGKEWESLGDVWVVDE